MDTIRKDFFCEYMGAPLFHVYENVVRKDNNTGLDKLLHFLYSAKYCYITSPHIAKRLGEAKEFINDEIYSWFNKKENGWDNLDVKANNYGIIFGKELSEK